MTQLITTVVIQMDDVSGEFDLLDVIPEEALVGLFADGYTSAYIHDGKIYLLPIRTADYPNIHPMTEEEWQAQNVVVQENL